MILAVHRRLQLARCAFSLRVLLPSIIIFSTLAFPLFSLAQTVPDSEETISIRTDLVIVPITVTDPRRRFVTDLTREDFVVRDNGRDVPVTYFATGTERVALMFLLDASGSARQTIAQQREAALALFERFGTNSRVAVLRFDEEVNTVAPFTNDADRARAAFRLTAVPNRRTAIFDAAMSAVQIFNVADSTERRIIVLISDGLDTASTTRHSEVIAQANLRGVSFYVIHLPLYAPRGNSLAARPPSRGFRELAARTGGRFFTAGDVATALDPPAQLDLTSLFGAIENDLRAQYLLGFYRDETGRGQSLRRIEVDVTSRQRLRVRNLREGSESDARGNRRN